jgi:hypothetical protein
MRIDLPQKLTGDKSTLNRVDLQIAKQYSFFQELPKKSDVEDLRVLSFDLVGADREAKPPLHACRDQLCQLG